MPSIPIEVRISSNQLKYDEFQSNSQQNAQNIAIKSSGPFLNRNYVLSMPSPSNGVVSTIWNYPIRGNIWRFRLVCFRSKQSNEFVASDERGQVVLFSLDDNTYQTLRSASTSTAITALCFIESRRHEVAIAFASGAVVVIDSCSRDLVMTVLPNHAHAHDHAHGHSSVLYMKSHPLKPILLTVDQNNVLSLFDLR